MTVILNLKKSIYFTTLKKDVPYLKNEFKARKQHGFEVSWLNRSELQKMGLNAIAAIESKNCSRHGSVQISY
ncbi:hypothetical protein AAGS39_34880 [Flavobacterium sp. CGRL2]